MIAMYAAPVTKERKKERNEKQQLPHLPFTTTTTTTTAAAAAVVVENGNALSRLFTPSLPFLPLPAHPPPSMGLSIPVSFAQRPLTLTLTLTSTACRHPWTLQS